MLRIGIYCEQCLNFLGYGREVPDLEAAGGLEWVERCDRCASREAERQQQVDRLQQLWTARQCAAPDCEEVFEPATSTQRFHSDRCRKRTHWRLKAQRARAPASFDAGKVSAA